MSEISQMTFAKRILSTILFVCFLNFFFFKQFGYLGIFLILLGGLVFILASFVDKKLLKTHKNFIIAASAGYVALVGVVIFRANFVIDFIVTAFSLFFLMSLFYVLNRKYPHIGGVYEFLLSPIRILSSYLTGVGDMINFPFSREMQKRFAKVSLSTKSEKTMRTVAGVLISVPILFVLILLLSEADPIFNNFVANIGDSLYEFFKNITISRRVVISAVFFFLLLPFAFFSLSKKLQTKLPSSPSLKHGHEFSIVLILVSIVFVVFLAVQAPYVFVSVPKETDLSQFGVATYSEYVNKGFSELLMVSAFTFSLLWFGLLTLRNSAKNELKLLKLSQVGLIGVFSVFILSVFRRVALYVVHHGWTLDRFYGALLLFWIAMLLSTLFARHFWDKRWFVVEVAMTTFLILFVGYFKAESYIVHHSPPTVNDRVDYLYLSRMSADGYDGWKDSYDFAKKSLTDESLLTEGMKSNEQYRDFGYSGMILGELLKHKFNLTRQYGSESEKLSMYSTMVESILEVGYLSPKEKEGLESLKKDLDEGKYDLVNLEKHLDVNYYIGLPGEPRFDHFYNYWPNQLWRSESNYSMVWNMSTKKAYESMKDDISFSELDGLIRIYIDVRRDKSNRKGLVFVQDTNPRSVFLWSF